MVAFDIGIATIFAREVLEGSIILQNYRTLILRSPTNNDFTAQDRNLLLRALWMSSLWASALAIAICLAVGISLSLLSKEWNADTAKIIEGISKIVAAICVLGLSVKFPKWLGVYPRRSKKDVPLTMKELRFNVAWNIWREVAECGVFLIPYFLAGTLEPIPFSALIGVLISGVLVFIIWYTNKRGEPLKVCSLMVILAVMLSIGLFTSGCHKLELVFGSSPTVWSINGAFWDDHKFPMTIIHPFGYNHAPTVLQIVCFISWLSIAIFWHIRTYQKAQALKQELMLEENSDGIDVQHVELMNKKESGCTVDDTEDTRTGIPTVDTAADNIDEEHFSS